MELWEVGVFIGSILIAALLFKLQQRKWKNRE